MYEDVKREVAIAHRILAEVGLCNGITASLGHISMRVPGHPEHFIVKGRGYEIDALPRMTPEEPPSGYGRIGPGMRREDPERHEGSTPAHAAERVRTVRANRSLKG